MKKIPLVLASIATVVSLASCGNKVQKQLIEDQEQQQLVFEDNYIKGKWSYGEGQKFAMQIITNIGSIAAGCAFESPTAITSGIFGLLNAVSDNFCNNGPTIADVINKLNEMDTKLDTINQKIDENYNQLMSETIRTQAMVDQVLLEEMEQAINSFNTSYAVPLENYTRDFADYIDQSYKEYVAKTETADIYVYKNADKEWTAAPLAEQGADGQKEIKFQISSFSNAVTFLEKNDNIVKAGFIDRLNEDIDEALECTNIPCDINKETVRNFVSANIVEKFTKKYCIDNHDKVLNLRNMAINYAKQINGKSAKSVVDRYLARLKYMFNFYGEMKSPATGAIANLMYNLNTNAALAAQACMFGQVNSDELQAEYLNAIDYIQKSYQNMTDIKDNYCFVTSTCLSGDFYKAKFNTSWGNPGNDCYSRTSLDLQKVDCNVTTHYRDDNFNNHNALGDIDNLRITMRYNLMRQIGLTDAANYIEYLGKANIISKTGIDSYNYFYERRWISNDGYRVFTGLSVRDLNDGDKGFSMACDGTGNGKGDYFNLNWTGCFRGGHESDKWYGRIAETTFIDGFTGKTMNNKRVAAYALYNESHWYWRNDEHWSFVDNKAGNYFFIIDVVIA